MLGFYKRVQAHAWPHIGIKSQKFPRCNIQAFISAALRSSNWSFQENFILSYYIPGFFGNAGSVSG